MGPKFKYGDNVTIVKGCHRGLKEQVINYDGLLFLYTVSIDNSWHYRLVEEEDLKLRPMTILIHKECDGEVKRIGEDGIDYCTLCETIVEGEPVEEINTEEIEE